MSIESPDDFQNPQDNNNGETLESESPTEEISTPLTERIEGEIVGWSNERALSEMESVYKTWRRLSEEQHEKDQLPFNKAFIRKSNPSLFNFINKRQLNPLDLLTGEAKPFWSRRETQTWDDDALRFRFKEIFEEWTREELPKSPQDRKAFSPIYISSKDIGFYTSLSTRIKKGRKVEEFLPKDASGYWSRQESKTWDEPSAREGMEDLFQQWKKEGETTSFSPKYLFDNNRSLFQYFDTRSLLPEDYLSDEARDAWQRRERTKWDVNLFQKRFDEVINKWKSEELSKPSSERKKLNHNYILAHDGGLAAQANKGRIDLRDLLSPEDYRYWDPGIWTREHAQKILSNAFEQWKISVPEENREVRPFNAEYVNSIGLSSFITREKLEWKELLPLEARLYWKEEPVNKKDHYSLWNNDRLKAEVDKAYQIWVSTELKKSAEDRRKFSLGFIKAINRPLYEAIQQRNIDTYDYLSEESKSDLNKFESDVAAEIGRLRMERIFNQWKDNEQKVTRFSPSYIDQKDPSFRSFVARNHLSYFDILPEEAKEYWEVKRIWNEQSLKIALADVFKVWTREELPKPPSDRTKRPFNASYIKNHDLGLYAYITSSANNIDVNSLLPDEAKNYYVKRKISVKKWTPEILRERLEIVFRDWKDDPILHRTENRFSTDYIKKRDSAVHKLISSQKIPITRFLSEEALQHWDSGSDIEVDNKEVADEVFFYSPPVYTDLPEHLQKGRREKNFFSGEVNENDLRLLCTSLYNYWNQYDKPKGVSFNLSYINRKDSSLCMYIKTHPEKDFEPLPKEVVQSWMQKEQLDPLSEEDIRSEIEGIFHEWQEEATSDPSLKFNGTYINKKNSRIFNLINRAYKGNFDQFLPIEAQSIWNKREKKVRTDETIRTDLAQIFKEWSNLVLESRPPFNTKYIRQVDEDLANYIQAKKEGNYVRYLPEEAVGLWEGRVRPISKYDVSLIRERVQEIYNHWKAEDALKGVQFTPRYIIARAAGLASYLTGKSLEEIKHYFNEESFADLIPTRARSVYNEQNIRNRVEELFLKWKSTAKEGDKFQPNYLRKADSSLAAAVDSRGGWEQFLPEEAHIVWSKEIRWDERLIQGELESIYQKWVTSDSESTSFSPRYIQNHNNGLYQHIQSRRGGDFLTYLPPEARAVFKVREIQSWSEERVKEELQDAFMTWREDDHFRKYPFGATVLRKINSDVYRYVNTKLGGDFKSYLSPEALDEWKESTKRIVGVEEEKLAEDLRTYLVEIQRERSVSSEHFNTLIGLFGTSQVVDILYILHPEYKGLPSERVRASISEYLGNFLLTPIPFNLENLDKAPLLLSEPALRENLYEVLKHSCFTYLHERKQEGTESTDPQIIHDYLGTVISRVAEINDLELTAIVHRVVKYYEDTFNGFTKPERIVDELNGGTRTFPDTAQLVNIKEISDKKRMLLADEMGGGKSASAILTKESRGLRQAIIVAPSDVLTTWEGYLSDRINPKNGKQIGYFKPNQAPSVCRVRGKDDFNDPALLGAEYILVSQELLGMDSEYVTKLKELNSDMLIIDEVHKIKNIREGIRAGQVLELANHIQGENKYMVAMSGTPIPNKVEDIAIHLKLLYPEEFADVDSKVLVSQIINSDILSLRNYLMPRMQMKMLAETVEMPPLNEEIVYSELSETEKDLYEVLLEEDEVTAQAKMKLLRTFLLNPALLNIVPAVESTKFKDFEEKVNNFFTTRNKLVVYVNTYIEGIIRGENNIIENLSLPPDVKVRVIEGNVSQEEREAFQEEFHNYDGKILLVISGPASDVGIDLSPAQGLYEFNEPWTMSDKRQQLGRSYRPGLANPLEYLTFITKGTIEEGIHEYILEKDRVIQKLIKGIPISELERQFISEAEKLEKIDLDVNPELAEYYFSTWSRLMRIFASMKEIGEEKFAEFVEKRGEEYAESYAELGTRSYQSNTNRVAATLISTLAQEAGQNPDDLSILDVASGPEMLRQHAPEELQEDVVSIDRNPYHFRGSTSGKAAVGSFTKVPLQTGSFDYVNLALGLHYTRLAPSKDIYERLEVLTELNRVLKEGGKAVISFMYSLDLKDEEQFEEIAAAFGFEIVQDFSGDVAGGENYKGKVVVLEKKHEVVDSIEDIVDILLEDRLDGIKFKKSTTRLKDSRRTVDHVELNDRRIDIRFNLQDLEAYREEQKLIDEAEEMKVRAGGVVEDIPPDEIIEKGFSRFDNSKRYVLYKKLTKAPGSVVVR